MIRCCMLAMILMLSGCGQSGPLYFPDETAMQTNGTTQTAQPAYFINRSVS